METKEIENLIIAGIPDATVHVSGSDGKYQAEIISATFGNLNQVQRHQAVYATLQEQIQNGQLHALSILALTPQETESR